MHTLPLRIADLCAEACERAADAVERMKEFEESSQHQGRGVHRDPTNILTELRDDISDLFATVREARDEIERTARGGRR